MEKQPTLKDIVALLDAIEDYEIKGPTQWIGPNGRRFRTSAAFGKYLNDTARKNRKAKPGHQ